MASQITAVRLPVEVVRKIDSLVGKGNRSRFIADAIERELKQQARLEYIEKEPGMLPTALFRSLRLSTEAVCAF
ncbi:MAG: YlcI/YnfO family protein [Thermacetogeniaceae bacterium]